MHRIKDSNGERQDITAAIQRVVEEYYEELFTTKSLDGKLTDGDKVKRVQDSDNEDLILEISREEVKEATFSMHPDKSRGPDELDPGFFSHFGLY